MKDLFDYLKKLQEHDFKVEAGKKHIRIYAPDGQMFTCSSTPSFPHAHRELFRDIRRFRRNKDYYLPNVK